MSKEKNEQFTEGIDNNWEYQQMQKRTAERVSSVTPAEKIDAYCKEFNLPIVDNYIPATVEFVTFCRDQGFRDGLETAKQFLNLNNPIVEENVEMNVEQMKAVLNEVLDARESDKRKYELAIAEQTTRQMEITLEQKKIELEMLRLQAAANTAPVEFELKPFDSTVNPDLNKLRDTIEQHDKAVGMITDVIKVTDKKPALSKRIAKVKNKIEEVQESVDKINAANDKVHQAIIDYKNVGLCTPVRNNKGKFVISWKKTIEDEIFLDVMIALVEYAKELGVDVNRSSDFCKRKSIFHGAYVQFTKIHKGYGAWKKFIATYIN